MISPDRIRRVRRRRRRDRLIIAAQRARAAAAPRRRAVSRASRARAPSSRKTREPAGPGDPGAETTSARVHQTRNSPHSGRRPFARARERVSPRRRPPAWPPPRRAAARPRAGSAWWRARRRRHGGGGGIVRPRLASRERGFLPFPRGLARNRRSRSCPRSAPRVERLGARRRAARRRRRRGRPLHHRRRRPKREALAFARRFCLGVGGAPRERASTTGRRAACAWERAV